MRALVHTAFGAARDVLRLDDIARPDIGPAEVLVRIEAAGIAKGNWLITRGLPWIARPSYGMRTPKHPVAGLAFSGMVVSVGRDVADLAPGHAVYGSHAGTLAELVAVPREAMARKPARVTFEEAAAAPVSGIAALQAVREAQVRLGHRVLVIGASGGVGSFAIQIAKALGAHVTGVASTANLGLVSALGADDVIDYTRDAIDARGVPYDVILDIAGNRPVSELRRVLTDHGTLAIVGGTGSRFTMGFERTLGAVLLDSFVRHRLVAVLSSANRADLETLADLIDSGAVQPTVQEVVPLARAADAIERAGTDHGHGTMVVTLRATA